MWYPKLEKKTFISRHILHQDWYICSIALAVLWNSPLTVASAASAPSFQPLRHQRKYAAKMEPLYATNISQYKQKTFLYEYPLHWVLLPTKNVPKRCSSVIHSSSTVAILTTKTSLWTCACKCYLDCHEAGLCCYLLIHIENLLYPLQLFYFHLCPIYWLFLILCHKGVWGVEV
jgi:hypothetical protein